MAQTILLSSPDSPNQLLVRLRDVSAVMVRPWPHEAEWRSMVVVLVSKEQLETKMHETDVPRVMEALNKGLQGLRAE